VAQPWAGKSYGAFFWPRVGHEVVVAFLEGNPDEPIVVGSVYNAGHMPPSELPKTRMVNGLRTSSTPGGGGYNGLTFDDTKGKEAIVLHGQHDMTTTVEHDDKQTVGNDRTITVRGKHTETITKDTKITIAEGKYEHEVLTGTADYHVVGALKEHYDAGQTTTVQKGIEIHCTDSKIEVFAATQLLLSCGDGKSSLLLKNDGTVELQGVKITVNGETITSCATGTHEVLGGLVKIN
jgi:type VI secretion system secreted protein VgrG